MPGRGAEFWKRRPKSTQGGRVVLTQWVWSNTYSWGRFRILGESINMRGSGTRLGRSTKWSIGVILASLACSQITFAQPASTNAYPASEVSPRQAEIAPTKGAIVGWGSLAIGGNQCDSNFVNV